MWDIFFHMSSDHYVSLAYFFGMIFIFSGLHEYAHARIAYACGDMGVEKRVTLNPLKHIGLVPTILFPALILYASGGQVIFGSAKPVPINIEALRHRGRDTMAAVLAGPGMNLLLIIVTLVIMIMSKFFMTPDELKTSLMINFLGNCVLINALLVCLNMIPFPPLDGIKAFYGFLPRWRFFIIIDLIGVIALLFVFWNYPQFFMTIMNDYVIPCWKFVWKCYVRFPV
ncbi:site-2 protease family protein [Candidatus Uabimicrobium amorphum]|uniref:Peptidase M50 n=1 Tax=Uabimicrobium amorphum TaxID=2596890 RepID=A0A5S9F6S9_UABAM|nr:site-2 protease family protein [Candidatus Uabimicrobium amorphum]BBM88028.1 peptidase M50 [Candidatus Uabimicrobium amorphum]